MKLGCDDVRDLAPDLLMGSESAAVVVAAREHIARCAGCAAELEVARAVSRQRVQAPVELHDRVVDRIVRRSPARRTTIQLAIAATVALVLVGGRAYVHTRDQPGAESQTTGGPRTTDPAGPGWMTVDGALNSGAASLGDLSEEQLRQLLTELES